MCDTEERHDPNQSRWSHLRNILGRRGMFNQEEFIPDESILDCMLNDLKILVIGAGGLGCELLKDLTLSGLLNIHVIDMDTIDLSNLNRQFLFRQSDIGKPKAEVAAAFINQRVPGANVKPHFTKIQEKDDDFYRDFHIVVCGVDSILARRWINGMLLSLLEYDSDGKLDQSSVRILVDGGTEGFKGNVRVITPGMSACLECTLDLYPPQVNYPMCTIAHTPRQPEHCVEYIKMFLWEKEDPFGGLPIDGDNSQHIEWIFNSAQARAGEYGIQGVTYRLTQGVIKRIIPAVASTNAVIAAACVNEVFKCATQCYTPMNNYMVFNDVNGVYSYTFAAERNSRCLVCSQQPRTLNFTTDAQLRQLIDHLKQDPTLQMKNPSLTTIIDGKTKTLYMTGIPSLEVATRPNLPKTLKELGLVDGHELICADVTSPTSLRFILHYTDNDMAE